MRLVLESDTNLNMAALNHIKNSAQHYSIWESVTKEQRTVKTHLEFAVGHNCGPVVMWEMTLWTD